MGRFARAALAALLALLAAALLIGALAALAFAFACALVALATLFLAAPKECQALLAFLRAAVARCENEWLGLARTIRTLVSQLSGLAASLSEPPSEKPQAPDEPPPGEGGPGSQAS